MRSEDCAESYLDAVGCWVTSLFVRRGWQGSARTIVLMRQNGSRGGAATGPSTGPTRPIGRGFRRAHREAGQSHQPDVQIVQAGFSSRVAISRNCLIFFEDCSPTCADGRGPDRARGAAFGLVAWGRIAAPLAVIPDAVQTATGRAARLWEFSVADAWHQGTGKGTERGSEPVRLCPPTDPALQEKVCEIDQRPITRKQGSRSLGRD